MPDNLQVDVVSADRVVWTGEATFVVARTPDGEIGVLRNHAPVLSVLVPGRVELVTVDNQRVRAVVDGGFLSVANNRVSILSGHAELADEIDVARARQDLEAARQTDDDDAGVQDRIQFAEARLAAAEQAT
jgi:F-type H+-transporting ATPase subunit epsilon